MDWARGIGRERGLGSEERWAVVVEWAWTTKSEV